MTPKKEIEIHFSSFTVQKIALSKLTTNVRHNISKNKQNDNKNKQKTT
jgi:hypothetical protein